MAEEPRQNLTNLLVKIPLFRGLGPNQCREILQVSHQRSFAQGDIIYRAGSTGDEMLILLKGRVRILVGEGKEVASVEAIDTVGEMEIMGSSPRVADVVAGNEVSGLTLGKGALMTLFESDAAMGIQLLRNIVENLAGKLAVADQELAARIAH